MDDAGVMRGGERAGHADAGVDHFAQRHRAARDALAEVLALDELHGHEVDAVGIADLVDRDDVRVVERRRRARLALETAHALLVLGEAHRQQFQRRLAVQRDVLGEINLAHATRADEPFHAVMRQRFGMHGLRRA